MTSDTKGALTMKVIGAGFGRTGTLSLKAALEELGFGPCYHMVELFHHPEHISYWDAAIRGEPVAWNMIFEGYQATVDWPGCAFYEQLMEAYPDAKVLLSVRDPDKWYESASATIFQMQGKSSAPASRKILFFLVRLVRPNLRRMMKFVRELVWKRTFDGNFQKREHAIAIFKRHIEQVKQHVPSEKLLVYNVKEGWEPLCTFLGVEVPKDKPFPHLNDRETFGSVRRARQRIGQPG